MRYLKFNLESCGISLDEAAERLKGIKALSLFNEDNMPFLKSLNQNVDEIRERMSPCRERFDTMVVVGIGGSSLGMQTIYSALSRDRRLIFLENIDPSTVNRAFETVNWESTLCCFISKSGRTLETVSIMNLVIEELRRRGLDIGERTVFISDRGSRFHELSESIGSLFFEIPRDIGGRYSVLTPAALVPSEFLGIDTSALLEGAGDVLENVDYSHPSLLTAAIKLIHYENGRNVSVLMPYSDRLRKFSDWYSQLWAESLGKEGKGQTPLGAVGTVDQHSLLQLFMEGPDDKFYQFIKVEGFEEDLRLPEDALILDFISGKRLSEVMLAEFEGTVQSLMKRGRPLMTVEVERVGEEELGALFMHFMVATAVAGKLMGVNPFNQPGVELGKRIAREKLKG